MKKVEALVNFPHENVASVDALYIWFARTKEDYISVVEIGMWQQSLSTICRSYTFAKSFRSSPISE